MMEWGDPNLQVIRQGLARRKKNDEVRESQTSRIADSLTSNSKQNSGNTIVHNHFNIIINITRDTTEDRITSLTEKLTVIARRVNQVN